MLHNTEDKKWWVISGREKEDLFVNEVCPNLGIGAVINPEKETNPYVPDLLVHGRLADLKCQETPFFRSGSLYQIPSQYAVTFNRKDYLHYSLKYPDIVIYFWIDWKSLSKDVHGHIYKVNPMAGVWVADFQKIREKIECGKAPLHSYMRRSNDVIGNAKDSYLFDVRHFQCLYVREELHQTASK